MDRPLKIFILEDDPNRIQLFRRNLYPLHHLTIVESVDLAKKLFVPPYDIICLDHDLGGQQMVDSGEENTGFQFAKWLSARYISYQPPYDLPKWTIFIHSYNPVGAKNIYNALEEFDPIIQPFGPTLFKLIQEVSG